MQNGAGPRRTSVVVPVPNDRQLRRGSWIDNRRYVDRVTGGKVGYAYLPDSGIRLELDQMALADGKDTQLDAAIGCVMGELAKTPPRDPDWHPPIPMELGKWGGMLPLRGALR